eukprot:16435736-Heterocapsa_arctica.AAC.1
MDADADLPLVVDEHARRTYSLSKPCGQQHPGELHLPVVSHVLHRTLEVSAHPLLRAFRR